MKILIVDDEFVSRRILHRILSVLGVCDLACDGEEAIEAWRLAVEETHPYDLVILDILMPKLDGMAVLERLREEEASRGVYGNDRVKVVMATACDDSSHVVGSFNAQCDGYLVKPFTREKVLEDIARHLIRLND